ncbi:tRNA (adenosine(37)-N6)-threonylcarbamoyltransferase complex ATPase subunit type 1 TsaE [Peribacillus cavernae]|uniref:tRNA threonylcarbamoyladenosine biosynthesis protein TsaE n=1 Tax=Peribacillus cavernae TaxID=1674310 RepID=A0A433HGS0_9BACI|nr:tRNA (adenosine(37)-N6)-threonylcarbamoyltransferase complex ATPase subunit type 1 TsaE [Peribacillus cavernae]MDQ0221379.1 tRNA threonylcarbamoyladenosine biosynthesis protein TsaE [Peribacillus cavernae]RUQ27508.1 tRNA (adenosine(37)-N6)-threonylcarbamoyltransferase complex ATPase subunit type 1 TsaE [Peribacillus cavernae]
MQQFEIISANEEETVQFAENLAARLTSGDVIALEGDLGAGKTAFTKGIASGLGVTRNVNSPTFTIIKEYRGRIPLYHMDVYRVSNAEEDLGFEEYFEGEGVTVIEWAHLIKDQLPEDLLVIYIFRNGDTSRRFVLEPHGERYVSLCKEIV